MLSLLKMKNLALVESAELKFGPGLHVLTGESGSGKSVVLDALALVSGATRPRLRAKSGTKSGLAEAEFLPERNELDEFVNSSLQEALSAHGLLEACRDPREPIVLARRIEASGRTRCFIQGQTVSRAALSAVGQSLLEMCGQGDAHGLRTPTAQLEALDLFAGLGERQRALGRKVKMLRALTNECETARLEASEAERRRDFVEFQLRELEGANVVGIQEKRERLEELNRLKEGQTAHEEVVRTLRSSDGALIPQLNWLMCRLGALQGDEQADFVESLQSAMDQLNSVALAAQQTLSSASSYDDERDALAADLKELDSLAEKHRVRVEDLPARHDELKTQLRESSQTEARHQLLCVETEALRAEAQTEAEKLHRCRRKAAGELEHRVMSELAAVGLEGARLETHLSRGELGPTGITHLDIGFSANAGHDAAPLSRVASGGELARVLLCFRLATDFSGAILSFDEIDAGAGGQTAEKIAQSLKRAGERGQVLCVTHWAQVASVAETHFAVVKEVHDSNATSRIREVRQEKRLDETSRMLGGSEETARQHASHLLRSDKTKKAPRREPRRTAGRAA